MNPTGRTNRLPRRSETRDKQSGVCKAPPCLSLIFGSPSAQLKEGGDCHEQVKRQGDTYPARLVFGRVVYLSQNRQKKTDSQKNRLLTSFGFSASFPDS